MRKIILNCTVAALAVCSFAAPVLADCVYVRSVLMMTAIATSGYDPVSPSANVASLLVPCANVSTAAIAIMAAKPGASPNRPTKVRSPGRSGAAINEKMCDKDEAWFRRAGFSPFVARISQCSGESRLSVL